jgi:hypothetical protein
MGRGEIPSNLPLCWWISGGIALRLTTMCGGLRLKPGVIHDLSFDADHRVAQVHLRLALGVCRIAFGRLRGFGA